LLLARSGNSVGAHQRHKIANILNALDRRVDPSILLIGATDRWHPLRRFR
jgi:hypothetical protein